MEELKKRLLQAIKNDQFFNLVNKEYIHNLQLSETSSDTILNNTLIELHNHKKINLISLCLELKKTATYFWNMRMVLQDILPDLDAGVIEVAELIAYLIHEAGRNDLANSMLFHSLEKFCLKDIQRIETLLEYTLNFIDETNDFVSIALKVGSQLDSVTYTQKAIELLSHESDIVLNQTIFALASMTIDKQEKENIAIQICNISREKHSDQITVNSLYALSNLCSSDHHQILISFLDEQKEYSDYFVDKAAYILEGYLSYPEISKRFWTICSYVKVDYNTINKIDDVLWRLVENNRLGEAKEFLELFFKNNPQAKITAFKTYISVLAEQKNQQYLFSLLTKWLLSRKMILGKACMDLVAEINAHRNPFSERLADKELPLEADISLIPKNDLYIYLFLAQKACGWLFGVAPVSMTSFIFSLIEHASIEELPQIQELLFNPIIINYPNIFKELYAKNKSSYSLQTIKIIEQTITEFDQYSNDLKSSYKLKELTPNESDRFTYQKYWNNILNNNHKEVRKQSIFAAFAKNQLILDGSKIVQYAVQPDKNEKRFETPLNIFKTIQDTPSTMHLATEWLEDLLRTFKTDGCVK